VRLPLSARSTRRDAASTRQAEDPPADADTSMVIRRRWYVARTAAGPGPGHRRPRPC